MNKFTLLNNSMAGAFALFICSSAVADTSVFGLKLGEEIQLTECPFRMAAGNQMYDATPAKTCFQKPHAINGYGVPVRRIIFSAAETPEIVKNWTIMALEDEGKLIGVHFMTNGISSQELVLQQLTTKFGAPTNSRRIEAKNLQGATFESIEAEWDLQQLHVAFDGTTGKLTTGQVFIDLPAAKRMRESWTAADQATRKKL